MWAWAAAAAALIACAALVGARRARRRFRSLVAADHERLRGRPPATTRRSLPPLVAAFEARAGLESSAGSAFVRVV